MRTIDGRYRLDELVGSGGMAEVWRGYDRVLHRVVAVKVLAAKLASDRHARQRARREASAVAQLSHPNIAAIYDVGTYRQGVRPRMPYIVMEFVNGPTLHSTLHRGEPSGWRAAAEICAQVAAALAAAHAHGVVHRDVKPANVMLTARPSPGTVKVVDFGLAAPTGQAQHEPSGLLVGTPAYMAPEQLRSEVVTPASDVYALGLLLHRMLIGALPWPITGDVLKIRYSEPLVTVPTPDDVPDELAALCRACLQSDPAERPNAGEAAAVLRRFCPEPPVSPAPSIQPESPDPDGTAPFALPTVRCAAPRSTVPIGAVQTVAHGRQSLSWNEVPRRRRTLAVGGAFAVATAAIVPLALNTRGHEVGTASAAPAPSSDCAVEYVATRGDGRFEAVLTVTANTAVRPGWSLRFTLAHGQRLTTAAPYDWSQNGSSVTFFDDAPLDASAPTRITVAGRIADDAAEPPGAFTLNDMDCARSVAYVHTLDRPSTGTSPTRHARPAKSPRPVPPHTQSTSAPTGPRTDPPATKTPGSPSASGTQSAAPSSPPEPSGSASQTPAPPGTQPPEPSPSMPSASPSAGRQT